MNLRQMWSWAKAGGALEPLREDRTDAADFVRRLYENNGRPNAKLREFYRRGQASLIDGTPRRPHP